MNHMKNTICRLRWSYPIISLEEMQVRTCCRTPPIKIQKSQLDQEGTDVFINNVYLKERRKEMLEGIRHSDCNICWNLEDQGILSPRHSYEKTIKHLENYETASSVAEEYSNLNIDSRILYSKNPTELEIKLGNTCDMGCVYCSHVYSTVWQAERIRYGEISPPVKKEGLEQFEELFWKWFDEIEGGLHQISFIGGEPVLIKNFYNILDILQTKKRKKSTKKIILNIISNFNSPPAQFQKFLDYLPKLCENYIIKLDASCEAYGSRAEYIRYGMDWNRFESNINKVLSMNLPNFEFGFQIALNALCISSLQDFLQFALELRERYEISIPLKKNIIHEPYWQSPFILTPDFSGYLDDCASFLRKYNHPYYHPMNPDDRWITYAEWLFQLSNGLRNEKNSVSKRIKFYEWFTDYDCKRGTNFVEAFPEYLRFWSECAILYFDNKIENIGRHR